MPYHTLFAFIVLGECLVALIHGLVNFRTDVVQAAVEAEEFLDVMVKAKFGG